MRRPDAIFTADWHLRSTTPVCRTDKDFQKSMWEKVLWIKGLQIKYKCPVLHAGDLFDVWKEPHWLVSKTIRNLPQSFYTVFGNHELPQHSLANMDKSALWTLVVGGHVNLLKGHYGDKEPEGLEIKGRKILMLHVYTYIGNEPWPGCTHPKAHAVLNKYKDYDVIVTGDNHQSFTQKAPGHRLLVNPGSLMRQDADQIDFEPVVYFWYADSNKAVPVPIPIKKGVVTREHIETKNENDEMLDAYVSRMNMDWELSANFDVNIEMYLNTNRVRKQVKEIVLKCCDYEV
jgi:predicted phosphodiesterase